MPQCTKSDLWLECFRENRIDYLRKKGVDRSRFNGACVVIRRECAFPCRRKRRRVFHLHRKISKVINPHLQRVSNFVNGRFDHGHMHGVAMGIRDKKVLETP